MIKILHVTTVSLSILLFVSRGTWIYFLKRPLSASWVKIAPHVNDTILLISGIGLAIQYQQYPMVHGWLTVKIACLLVYILLGMVAMKWRYQRREGLLAWLVAIVIYVFMLSVAMTHHPWGLLGLV